MGCDLLVNGIHWGEITHWLTIYILTSDGTSFRKIWRFFEKHGRKKEKMRSYLEEKGKVKIKKSYKINTQTWKCFRVCKGNCFFLGGGETTRCCRRSLAFWYLAPFVIGKLRPYVELGPCFLEQKTIRYFFFVGERPGTLTIGLSLVEIF